MSRFFDRRLLSEATGTPGARLSFGAAVALGALGGVLTVLQAAALSRAVDGAFLGGEGLEGVRPWLAALVALAAARAAAAWAGDVTASRAAGRVKGRLRERLAAHILALGPSFARGERTGELANLATEGVEALEAYFAQYLPQLLLAAIVPATFLVLILPIDPLSGLVLLVTAPLIPLFMVLIGNAADARTRRQWTALSRLSAHFLDMLQGLPTLKLFGRSREQADVIRQVTGRHRDATLGVLRVAFLSALVLEMVGTLGTAIVAVEIGLRLLYGKAVFREALFVLVLAPEFYLPLRTLGTRFHAAIAGVAAARRIFEVLETRPEGAWQPGAAGEDAAPLLSGAPFAVCFEQVSYTYPGRDLPALDDLSLVIRPGEVVALVGPTGAGKSTVAALLLGFISPAGGRITVDGRPLGEVSPGEVPPGDIRRRVAWIPQAPYLFNASIADNIRLGRPEATLAEVERAAVAAHAAEFIRSLPQGYDTIVGERGARLSGGQAQRIALARAFLMDAPLVVLDEATASLDPETEAAVLASIARLTEGRSALIIAHRLSTVRRAGRIVVLEGGRAVESGSHDELLARRGAYWRLVSAARAPYADAEAASAAAPPEDAGAAISHQPSAISHPPPAISHPPSATSHQPSATSHPRRSNQQPATSFRLLLSFLWPFRAWILLSVALGALTVGSSIALLAASAWIIAAAALQPSIAALQVAIVGVRTAGIARGVFRYLERLVSHQVTFRVLGRLRAWFYAAVEPLAPARLASHRSGDLLQRVIGDIGTLEHFYVRSFAPPAAAVLVAVLMALLLAAYDPRLAWAALAFYALAGAGVPALAHALGRSPGGRLAAIRGRLGAALVDGIQGAADLASFGAGGRHLAGLRSLGDALRRAQGRMAAIAGMSNALAGLLAWLAVAAVLALAIPSVQAGAVGGVHLAVLVLATMAAFEAVSPLPLAAQYLGASLAAGRRLFELAGGSEEPVSPPEQPPADAAHGRPPLEAAHGAPPAIRIEGLTVRYAPEEPAALRSVTCDVPAGGLLAVVGPSGAGKSTLANVLVRFAGYEAGQVWIDGRELRSYEPDEVRRMIGMVTQHTHLFNASVRDNLRLARPGASQAELEEACRRAQVHDFIAALPQGYDTWIGEHGLRLSGGERQRLGVARALLKDAPVLILDEPAANLDAATEAALMASLKPFMAGRTTLLITHRLAGLEHAALGSAAIVVLDEGRAVEQGTHEALLARRGLYRRLWERQREALV